MDRHWIALTNGIKQYWNLSGYPPDQISPKLDNFCLQMCIDMQLHQFIPYIEDISNKASKE